MSATAMKPQPVQAARLQTRPQPKATAAEAQQTDISSNPVAKVVLDPSVKDEQKVETLTKLIAAPTLKDVQSFATYLAQRRTLAQRRLLELTSTTAFPRLQSVIGSLQMGVVEFDSMMQPMTDDLQAAFDLRTNDKMNEAIKEIAEDRQKEAAWIAARQRIDEARRKLVDTERELNTDIARLGQDTNIFGQVRKSAAQDIAEKKLALEQIAPQRLALDAEETSLSAEQANYTTRSDEYKTQKERLRKMLDLGPGYVKRVEDIVAKAIEFIDNSSTEVGAIRGEFDDLEEQSRNILAANAQMVRVTAILDKGIDGANKLHRERVQALAVVPADEDTLASVTRTQEKNDVERFVTALSETAISTKKNVTALQEDAVGANSFNTVVMKQQTNLRELHGDGIASITTNLNMALQAFNTAALTEAGNNAWQAIGDMNAVTNRIRDNQVVAAAMSIDDTNKRIIEKFDSLAGVNEALQEANRIRADGISNIASSLAELKAKTDEVQRNLQVNIGMDAAADVTGSVSAPTHGSVPDVSLMKL
jgi:hypothetical protein